MPLAFSILSATMILLSRDAEACVLEPTVAESPREPEASPAAAPRVSVAVTVDVGPDSPDVQSATTTAVEGALTSEGVELGEAAMSLNVDVRWVEGSTTNYAVSFVLAEPNAHKDLHSSTCDGCTPLQLLKHIRWVTVDSVAPQLFQAKAAREKVSDPTVEQLSPSYADVDSASPERKMFFAGVGMLPVGSGLILGGAIVMVADSVTDNRIGAVELSLVGAGAAVTAVSATLIGVALSREKQGRRMKARVLPSPQGLVLVGRF